MIIFSEATPQEKRAIKKAFICALKKLNQPQNVEISVSFVSAEEISQLNGQYRATPQKTDVLSFPMLDISAGEVIDDSFSADMDLDSGDYLLGDVFICRDVVAKQAAENGKTPLHETCYLAVHSLLHLLGYDHAEDDEREKMFALQDEIIKESEIK